MNFAPLTVALVFIVGLMIGGFAGMVLLSLLVMAGRREDSLAARELKNRNIS